MDRFESDDPGRPIETHPGYLGVAFDYELDVGPELSRLSEFDWCAYRILCEEAGSRQIELSHGSARHAIQIDDATWLGSLLGQLPQFRIMYDDICAGSPGSAAITIFFKRADVGDDEITVLLHALRAALDGDVSALFAAEGMAGQTRKASVALQAASRARQGSARS